MFDLQQAQRFIELLHGDADSPKCWQTFHDSKTTSDALKQPNTFHAPLAACEEYFNGVSAHNYGIYVTLNKTDGLGRSEENIIGYNAIFADIDNMSLPDFPIEPHFITQRDSLHSHAYWLVNGVVTGDQFKRIQKQVAMYLGSDEQVIDPCRVVRVAGSTNMKNPAAPAMYNIVSESDRTEPLTPDEITTAFPLTGEKLATLDKWSNSRSSLDTGDGFNDEPRYRTEFIQWCERATPAVDGNNGSETLYKTAGMGADLGIPLSECQELMWKHYDPRCIPTWASTGEQRDFFAVVARAYKYGNNEIGCRTTTAIFTALNETNPIIEPPCGWEENKKLGKAKKETPTIDYVPVEELTSADNLTGVYPTLSGATLAMEVAKGINNKRSVWDLSRLFVAQRYPECSLLRCDKVFYAFNGKVWEEKKDDTITSEVAWHYSSMALPPAKVNNIVKTIETIVHYAKLERKTWLKGKHDEDHTVVFKNGIVDLKSDGTGNKLIPHTPDYFNMNQLTYDYDPLAKCVEWLKFLDTVFKDPEQIKLLQEYMGYILTSHCRFQKFLILIGKSRAGKGVITDVMTQMLGEHNISAPNLESIGESSTLASMANKQLYLVPEVGDIHQSKKGTVVGITKSVTGGDSVDYHLMYKGTISNKKWGKMVWSTNNMPSLVDQSGALANRVLALTFTESFAGREDRSLGSRLSKEIAGILNWAIDGLKRLNANQRFTEPRASTEMVEDMKRDMFPLADFCEEACIVENSAFISSKDLYQGYLYFCNSNGIKKPMTQNYFGKILKASYLSVNQVRDSNGRGWKGIKLNDLISAGVKPTGNNVANFPVVENTNITGRSS